MSSPLRRVRAFRGLQVGVILAAAALFLLEAASIGADRPLEVLFFVGLATLAFRLRVRYAGNFLGLEAAAIVPAILVLNSPGATILICAAADTIARLLGRRRRLTLSTGFDLAQLSLSYGLAAIFFRFVSGGSAGMPALAARAAGVLLLFSFINTMLVFAYLKLGRLASRGRLLEMGLFQLVALLLLAPIVALEILMYPHYGVVGLLLGFFPVVLAAFVLRSLSSMEEKYNRVARENQELDVMREISNVFSLGARGDRYRRVFEALRRILPIEAMAFVEWVEESGEEMAIHLEGEATAGRQTIREWIRHRRLDETWDGSAEEIVVRSGLERDVQLSRDTPFQVRVRLSTFELSTGLLVLESSSPALHSPAALDSLKILASQIALVLQDRAIRAQVQELSERNRERAETLHQILEISNELKRHLTPDSVFESIAAAVARGLGFHAVLLSLYDPEHDHFVRRAQHGLDRRWGELQGQEVPAAEITRYWIDRNRLSRSYYVRNRSEKDLGSYDVVVSSSRGRIPNGWRAYDMLFIPLLSGDRLVGCLSVDDPQSGLAPSLETVQALEIFANQAVAAIENAGRYTEAREQSIRDGLTGAYNHRYFQEALQREIGRAERQGRPVALLMLDIDDFKGINDRYGHPVGDAILERIVTEIRGEVRVDMDTLARYGGEEFALILPETPLDEAAEVAERIRRKVDERLFRPPDSTDVIRVTVSIGLAAFPGGGRTKKDLIEKADAALYRAKRAGKNAVVATAAGEAPAAPLAH